MASSFRPLFCGHAYSAKYEQVSKNGRPFPTWSSFLAFVCSLTRRRGLWRWSMFGRGWICTSGSEFSSALTRPGVRFVPGEGRGHVSKKAYWLVVEGVPIGRRASLAAYRSTITHVTAICDKKNIQRRLLQGGPFFHRRRAGADPSSGGV